MFSLFLSLLTSFLFICPSPGANYGNSYIDNDNDSNKKGVLEGKKYMKNCALVSSFQITFYFSHPPSPFVLLLFFLSFLASTFLFRLLSTPFSIQLSILKAFNIVSSSAITKAIATMITITISIIIKCIVMGPTLS